MTGYIGIGGTAKKIKNIYIGVGGTAKKVKKAYIGVGGVAKLWYSSGYTWEKYTTVPGYREVFTPTVGYVTTRDAFYVASTYSFDSTTGYYTVTQNMAIDFYNLDEAIGKYIYAYESGTYTEDPIFYIEDATYSSRTYRLTLGRMTSESVYSKGTYVGTVSSDNPTAYPVNGVQGDYWYVLVHNFGYTFSYTGNYSEAIAEMGGSYYHLLTLTSSGTLSLSKAVTADVWLCGGGANGSVSSSTYAGRGGGGGYAKTATNKNFSSLTVTVGAAGGNSSTSGGVSLSASGTTSVDGGTGGGGAYASSSSGRAPGTGDGNSKVPFSANDYFVYPYCDGGGAGGMYIYNISSFRYNGGAGGTNGSDGEFYESGNGYPGAGGGQYGGAGGSGNSTSIRGENATGYGSGGGGNGVYNPSSNQGYYNSTAAGFGYQGVCFIRIPFAA